MTQVSNISILALTFLLEGAAPGDIGRLRRRFGDELLLGALRHRNLSKAARRLAAEDPDPTVRHTVAASAHLDLVSAALLLRSGDPQIADLLTANHPDWSWLPEAVAAPDNLAAELYTDAVRGLSWRQEIDWTALRADHAVRPFPKAAATRLAEHPDCPREFVLELFDAHPAAVGPAAAPGRDLVHASLDKPRQPALAKLVTSAAKAALLDHSTAVRILNEATPARTAAALLGAFDTVPELTAAVKEHLGTDPALWEKVTDELPKYKGTLAQLLTTAEQLTPAPKPEISPPAALTPAYKSLLLHAPTHDLSALLPALPSSVVKELLGSGNLPERIGRAAAASADHRAWLALAGNRTADARVLKLLVAKQDPQVNSAVYRNTWAATQSLRRAVAAGPIPADLRVYVLASGERGEVSPMLCSGDPELTTRAIGFGCRKTAQLYGFATVWERQGPDAVRKMLADEAVQRTATRQILNTVEKALDHPGGLARLREQSEPFHDPRALVGWLQKRTSSSSIRDLLHEPYVHDFPALVAGHLASPYGPQAAERLLRHEDATDEDRRLFRLTVLNRVWGDSRVGNVTPVAERLHEPLDRGVHGYADWVTQAVAEDFADPLDVLPAARPAGKVVQVLSELDNTRTLDLMRHQYTAPVREHLAGHPEAWAVLLQLLPDFSGTLPELIALAAQVAGPKPDLTAETVETPLPGTPAVLPEKPEPQPVRRNNRREDLGTFALGAVDLLRSVADHAPDPADPEVLSALARTPAANTPGWCRPPWLFEACFAAAGPQPRVALAKSSSNEDLLHDLLDRGEPEVLEELDHSREPDEVRLRAAALKAGQEAPRPADSETSFGNWPTAPSPATAARWVTEDYATKSRTSGTIAQRALGNGVLTAAGLLTLVQARDLTPVPDGWATGHLRTALTDAARECLRTGLGTDTARWLGVLQAVENSKESLPDLIAAAEPSDVTGGILSTKPETFDPDTRWNASGTCETFPGGDLLLLADTDALTAVLKVLGPDAGWRLVAHVLVRGSDAPVRNLLDHAFAENDDKALTVIAAMLNRFPADTADRLLALNDPQLNARVYNARSPKVYGRTYGDYSDRIQRTILAQDVPLDPELRTKVLRETAYDAIPLWFTSAADPELVELTLRHGYRRLGIVEQLIGCRNLLRAGAADRLARLVKEGTLRAGAATLSAKALASGDPLGMVQAKLDKELAPPKLMTRLRACGGSNGSQKAGQILSGPYVLDWEHIRSEHARDPLPAPAMKVLMNRPDAPEDLAVAWIRSGSRYDGGKIAGRSRARAQASVAIGTGWADHRVFADFDRLVNEGVLTGGDLVHEARWAPLVLSYLNECGRRSDQDPLVTSAATDALAEIAVLAGELTDEGWQRVYARVTARDPDWHPADEGSTIAALLS